MCRHTQRHAPTCVVCLAKLKGFQELLRRILRPGGFSDHHWVYLQLHLATTYQFYLLHSRLKEDPVPKYRLICCSSFQTMHVHSEIPIAKEKTTEPSTRYSVQLTGGRPPSLPGLVSEPHRAKEPPALYFVFSLTRFGSLSSESETVVPPELELVMVPVSQTHRSEDSEWAWIESGRSTPCRRGEAPVSATRRAESVTRHAAGAVDSRDDDSAPPDSDTTVTVHYAPGTGTRPPREVGTNLWRNCRPLSGRRGSGTVNDGQRS